MVLLSVFYLCMILLPVIGILNDTVKAYEMIEETTIKKLDLLCLNCDLKANQVQDKKDGEYAAINNFRSEVYNLRKKQIILYDTPVYKFLFYFSISSKLRNKIFASIASTFTALLASLIIVLQ